jgi:SAM-dependent methyltransferase
VEDGVNQRAAWNAWHEKGDVESTDPQAVMNIHAVNLSADSVFLDVGVGVGMMARYAVGRGAVVDALDIADAARAHVDGIVRRFYLASEIDGLPTTEYSLALAHLVAQHMMDDDLTRQIDQVYRSLRFGGVYSIQFAGSDRGEEVRIIPSKSCVGHMVRTPEEAMALCLASAMGSLVHLVRPPERWPHTNTGHQTYYYYIHIRKPKR